jgi:hypothetical protein
MADNTPDERFDRAGVLLFLAATFVLSWAAQITLVRMADPFNHIVGNAPDTLSTAVLVGIMWIPGLCALTIHCLVQRRPLRRLLRPGNETNQGKQWKGFGAAMLIIPLVTAMAYGLTWALGLGQPDWNFTGLAALQGAPVHVSDVFLVMLPSSIVLGPLFNIPAALGEELGWRGFLLPRLMPLGKARAYLLLGAIWGLWHAPLIVAGLNYPGHPVTGIFMMMIACTAFGTFFNELTLSCRSVLLAAWMHGALNAQGYGIWHWMFPDVHPLLGGDTGLTGMLMWTIAALLAVRIVRAR